MKRMIEKTAVFLNLIRFEHTLFALPYAVAGAFLAEGGVPGWTTALWILVAMVGARTAAMSFNRLVDRRLDAENPRTASRPSANGQVSAVFMALATLISSAVFVAAAWQLNPLCLVLSGPTLVVLLTYSLTKRFFAGSHFVLGLALGLSPVGAWVAVRGELGVESLPAVALGLCVLFWTAGFDMLYACQDEEHDRAHGLFSIPASVGRRGAFVIARLCHVLVPLLLLGVGWAADLSYPWYGAVSVIAVLLVYEHRLVGIDDLSRLNRAFFTVNVAIGFIVMAGAVIDVLMGGGIS